MIHGNTCNNEFLLGALVLCRLFPQICRHPVPVPISLTIQSYSSDPSSDLQAYTASRWKNAQSRLFKSESGIEKSAVGQFPNKSEI